MDQQTAESVRRDIAETRARVSATLAELDGEVSGRRAELVERVTGPVRSAREHATDALGQANSVVTAFVQEHPWMALGIAVGLGAIIGGTGADAAAARGVASGVGAAAGGIAGGARTATGRATDAVQGLVHRDGASESESAASGAGISAYRHDPETGAIGSSAEDTGQLDAAASEQGYGYRLSSGLVEALGADELLAEMRREAGKIGRA